MGGSYVARRRRDGVVTPAMAEALRCLARGEPCGCGRPTRQRLDREGLAVYEPTFSFDLDLWDREMQITAVGREVLRLLAPLGVRPKAAHIRFVLHRHRRPTRRSAGRSS